MDSVAAEIEQKNQETFLEPEKKPRKPRSDAGQKRGPRTEKPSRPAKKSAKKAGKKAAKKSWRRTRKEPAVSDHQPVDPNPVNEEPFEKPIETPWRDFGYSLSSLCRHISRRTGIREAGRRLAGAVRMIWRGE